MSFKNILLILVVFLASSCCRLYSKSSDIGTPCCNGPITSYPDPSSRFTVATSEMASTDIQSVFFDNDSATLKPEAIAVLDKDILPIVKKSDVKEIEVGGYCDQTGSDQYNKILGLKRANAIKDYFVKNGVKSEKIVVTSYGKSKPENPGRDAAIWAKNPRLATISVKK